MTVACDLCGNGFGLLQRLDINLGLNPNVVPFGPSSKIPIKPHLVSPLNSRRPVWNHGDPVATPPYRIARDRIRRALLANF